MATTSWPNELDSTPVNEREEYTQGPGFQVEKAQALDNIRSELRKLGVADEDMDIDVSPPFIVAHYELDGEPMIVGSDQYDNTRDNAQAVAKYLSSKRAIQRYGVKTPKPEMSNTHLPAVQGETRADTQDDSGGLLSYFLGDLFSVDEDTQEEIDERELEDSEARMILGVDADASEDEIKKRARELAKEYHPDQNDGDDEQFKAVMNAKQELL